MNRLYLCYRNQDSAVADVIAGRWRIKHGRHSVVIDPLRDKPDNISLLMHIETKMLHADAIWILIGQQWSGIDEYGRYRLSTADIPIHSEVQQALNMDIPVSILLVNGVEGTGTFEGMVFKLPLEADEIARTEKYLRFEAGALTFHDAPGS